jgi:hypothetical protein
MITVYGVMSPHFNILSYRQAIIVPVCIFFGIFFCRKTDLQTVIKYLFPIFVVVALSGFIEILLYDSHETLWVSLGISEYMKMKGFSAWVFGPNDTPGSFYTHDFYSLFGKDIRRMTSLLITEPTLLGQFLVLPTLYVLLERNKFWMIFFLTALLCTLGKGGFLGVTVGYTLYYMQNKNNFIVKSVLAVIVCSLLVLMLYLSFTGGAFASVLVHTAGFFSNITGLLSHPFGQGIGSVGNFAVITGSATDAGMGELETASGESYLGSLIGQTGLIGLLAYCALFYYVYKKKVNIDDSFAIATKYGVLATLLTGIASESAISYVGTGYLFALLPFLFLRKVI